MNPLPEPWQHAHLIGHQDKLDQLLTLHQKKALHPVTLFSGQKGVGKATLAWRLIEHILSPGQTSNFRELVEQGSHLDFQCLHSPSGKTIPIAELRGAVSLLHRRPVLGEHRILLIDALDDLVRAGLNTLLKIIEEPPNWAYVFIISHNVYEVLPTILSRSMKVRVPSLDPSEMMQLQRCFAQHPSGAPVSHGANGEVIETLAAGNAALYLRLLQPQLRGEIGRLIDAITHKSAMAFVSAIDPFLRGDEFVVYNLLRTLCLDMARQINGLAMSPLGRAVIAYRPPSALGGKQSTVQKMQRLQAALNLHAALIKSEKDVNALNLVGKAEITDKWLTIHALIR
ncbi:MAG: hypothetical protein K0U36_02290 [Alphaproteobacteria bacterium]|nr:hypothetical protein [Alphaproteobacteria bacterium]